MTRTNRHLHFVLILAATATLAAACRRRPSPAPEPTSPATLPAPEPRDTSSTEAARLAADRERAEREAAARDREENARRERARAILVEPIHFEFDRSDLSESARSDLDAKLGVLRGDPSLRILVEGHTDDRGSDEYNLALGMRRAAAVRRYFVQRDVDPERIEIVSFGEERPVCNQSHEGCWRLNRRAEFNVVTP